ncbi:ABC transporter substrate-binding protein [Nocardia jinanensis]|uniref:ABC transporter substrate-binding protein n=1 Tax=Nocardia jinanensis TaxID=382504 RepID=A0A917RPG4_9NOCA|nr:ABC transporter substrate-binding protein [Nocardia jinanensis]GGL17362.1 ABC transporter substrate-binding protein [Nocardia jinanensis]
MYARTSRRAKLVVAGATVAVSALLLSACGGGGGPAAGGDLPESSTYVIAIPQDFQGVDRASYSSEASKVLADVMQSRLLEFETDASTPTSCLSEVPTPLNPQSALVEKWAVTPDGLGIEIALRNGVRSAVGNTLTAEDVKWTLDRAVAIDAGAQTLFFKVGGFDRANPVTVIDPAHLRMNLVSRNAMAPYVLASVAGIILDSADVRANSTPEDPWGKNYLTDNTANFGPWDLTGFTSQQLTFDRNPNFAGKRGNIDQILLQTVADASSRIQLLQSGQVAEVTNLDYTQLEHLRDSDTVNLADCANPARDWLGLNASDPIVGKPEVRQAISYALDRVAINQAVYRGFAAPSAGGLSAQFGAPAPDPDPYARDLDKARKLLSEAGYADGFTLDLSVSPAQPGPHSANLAAIVQQQLGEVGIEVNVVTVPSAVQFRSDGLAHTMQAWLLAETPAFANAGYSGWLTSGCGGLQNYAGFCNPEFDTLTAELMADSTGPRAQATTNGVATLIAEQQPAVYLADRSTINIRSICAEQVPASSFGTNYTEANTRCQ